MLLRSAADGSSVSSQAVSDVQRTLEAAAAGGCRDCRTDSRTARVVAAPADVLFNMDAALAAPAVVRSGGSGAGQGVNAVAALWAEEQGLPAVLEQIGVNGIDKEPPRCSAFPHLSAQAAAAAAAAVAGSTPATAAANYLDLCGRWQFHCARCPADRPRGFEAPGYQPSAAAGWADVAVPGNWEAQGYDKPIYLDERFAFTTAWPAVPREYNPVGSYLKTFETPAGLVGGGGPAGGVDVERAVFLQLAGARTATFVWLNGHRVGYTQNAKSPAEFDVTGLLRPAGNAEPNTLALQIYRWSNASYVEKQDMLDMSGAAGQ